jgi:hypothetical protein
MNEGLLCIHRWDDHGPCVPTSAASAWSLSALCWPRVPQASDDLSPSRQQNVLLRRSPHQLASGGKSSLKADDPVQGAVQLENLDRPAVRAPLSVARKVRSRNARPQLGHGVADGPVAPIDAPTGPQPGSLEDLVLDDEVVIESDDGNCVRLLSRRCYEFADGCGPSGCLRRASSLSHGGLACRRQRGRCRPALWVPSLPRSRSRSRRP